MRNEVGTMLFLFRRACRLSVLFAAVTRLRPALHWQHAARSFRPKWRNSWMQLDPIWRLVGSEIINQKVLHVAVL